MRKNCCTYPVETTEGVFGESEVLADALRAVAGSDSPRVLIVADMNVVQRTEGLGAEIGRYVQSNGIRLAGNPVVVAAGEKIKADNLKSALRIVSAMLEAKLGKDDVVLALGGGTLLDVAGYAAAQVRGGVKVVRVPTTPAAMLDAAFADYAAVDSATVKDALRVPSTPAAVVIDPSFAATVLDGVWRGGIGEAVRLAVACDASLMKKLRALAPAYCERDLEALKEIVSAACSVRAKKGPTSLAEWAAVRLEAMSGWKLPHGYAVCIGICIDSSYSVERGLLDADDRDGIVDFLDMCGALDGLTHSRHLLNQADNLLCGLDAWRLASGSDAITVPAGIGKSAIEKVPDRDLYRKVLQDMLSSSAEA
ncbi:MAG: iron-containing alcohol dehydrogenase [Kiritimatiellae bacterium]|nr:iron-containing alcohol dehydrogenase [Kiritimatiellia bacterium]